MRACVCACVCKATLARTAVYTGRRSPLHSRGGRKGRGKGTRAPGTRPRPAPSPRSRVRPQPAREGAWEIPGHPTRVPPPRSPRRSQPRSRSRTPLCPTPPSPHLGSCRSDTDRWGGSWNQARAKAARTSMKAHEAGEARARLRPGAGPARDLEPDGGPGAAPSPAPPAAPVAGGVGEGRLNVPPAISLAPAPCATE